MKIVNANSILALTKYQGDIWGINLSVYLFICLNIYLSIYSYIVLSLYLFYLTFYLYILSIHIYLYIYILIFSILALTKYQGDI